MLTDKEITDYSGNEEYCQSLSGGAIQSAAEGNDVEQFWGIAERPAAEQLENGDKQQNCDITGCSHTVIIRWLSQKLLITIIYSRDVKSAANFTGASRVPGSSPLRG